MVASSVVSTILILNYHHRSADTHEMSDWVSEKIEIVLVQMTYSHQIDDVEFFVFVLVRFSVVCVVKCAGAVSVFVLATAHTTNESATRSRQSDANGLSANAVLK